MADRQHDSSLTAEGSIAWDVDPQDGARPFKLRMAVYAGGKGDDRKTCWINVKFFPDAFDGEPDVELTRGTRVRVSDARFDGELWVDKKGNPQVDFLARKVEIVPREGGQRSSQASAPRRARPARPVPSYDYDEEPF